MSGPLLAFVVAVAVAALVTPLVRNAACRLGVLDHALTSRKVHGVAIPRLGGVAIVAAFFAAVAVALLLDRSGALRASRALALLGGGVAIAALGLFDDLRGSGARAKFSVQFAVALAMYEAGYRLDTLSLPIVGMIELGALGLPLTLVWIAGITNAVNLMDGLDGLAGGIAFTAAVATFVVAAGEYPATAVFSAALAGAVLGFLFFNLNPASIFMGDTGSLFLGFVLATTSIRAHEQPSGAVSMLVPIVALGLPIADTLLSMTRRALRGVPMFSADRGHIHHRLLAGGLSHRRTVLVMHAVAALLSVAALMLSQASAAGTVAVLALLGVGGAAGLWRLGFFDYRRLHELLAARRRNRMLHSRLTDIGKRLRDVSEPGALWEHVLEAAPALGAQHVALEVAANGKRYEFQAGLVPLALDVVRARYSIRGERPGGNVLELGWQGTQGAIDRDVEIAVEQLCGHMKSALQRMEGSDNVSSRDGGQDVQDVLEGQRRAASG